MRRWFSRLFLPKLDDASRELGIACVELRDAETPARQVDRLVRLAPQLLEVSEVVTVGLGNLVSGCVPLVGKYFLFRWTTPRELIDRLNELLEETATSRRFWIFFDESRVGAVFATPEEKRALAREGVVFFTASN